MSEVDRVQDVLRKRIKFENASFDKDKLVRVDLFRTQENRNWLSPRGFETATKG